MANESVCYKRNELEYQTTLFPANIEHSSLKTSLHLYYNVTVLSKFGAVYKSYLFLVMSRVPLSTFCCILFAVKCYHLNHGCLAISLLLQFHIYSCLLVDFVCVT